MGLDIGSGLSYPDGVSLETPDSKKAFFLSSAVAAIVFLAFSKCLANKFVWDDYYMVVQDPSLGHLSDIFKAMAKPLGYYDRNGLRRIGDIWRPV